MFNLSKKKSLLAFIFIAMLLILAWLFIGIEQVSAEFKEERQYNFFIKKHINTKFFFVDPTNCNAGCDTPQFRVLNAKQIEQFADYCLYKFDLYPAEHCYNLLYKKNN